MPPTNRQSTLNGLRGIAILLVVIAHAGLGHIVPGGLGVMLFFVLSGFLLGHQILDEQRITACVNWREFYWRRFWRLAPTLILYVIQASLIAVILGHELPLTDILSVLGGYSNLYELYTGYGQNSPFPITWSLSIEMQFYLLLPLLLFWGRGNMQRTSILCLAIMLCVGLWRVYVASQCTLDNVYAFCGLLPEFRILKSSDTIIDIPIIGVLTAILSRNNLRVTQSPLILGAALAILLFTLLYRAPFFRETLRYTMQGVACGMIILHVTSTQNLVSRFFSAAPLEYLGRISYPMYLFHFGTLVALQIVNKHQGPPQNSVELFSYILVSLALAVFSYEIIEKRFIRLRRRHGSRV